MAEIVNLRQARKRKRREDKDSIAAANRVRHGESRAGKERERRLRGLSDKRHAEHRRDKPDGNKR
jgi:hypothetical protein